MINTIKTKLNQAWNWIKRKVKAILIWVGIIGVAVAATILPPKPIPVDLQLKCDKADIVDSIEYTEYEHQKDAEGKIVLDKDKNPIIKSQKQIVSYRYKSGDIAPVLDNEIIEKRTQNIVTRNLGGNKRSAQSGYEFYKEDGKWKQIKHATTTKEVFNKVGLLDAFIAWAADTGATSPGTMADDDTVGTQAWANPDNAKTSNDSYAVGGGWAVYSTHYLKATNFGFDISDGATIDGIIAEIEKAQAGGTGVYDVEVKIVKSDASLGTTNKASASQWTGTDTYSSYGANNNLWGESWGASDINSSNFGVVLQAEHTMSYGIEIRVDHMRITVYYTEAAAEEVAEPQMQVIIIQ